MSVVLSVVAAALLTAWVGTLLPSDADAWRQRHRTARRRLGGPDGGGRRGGGSDGSDRGLGRVALAFALVGIALGTTGAPIPGLFVGGAPSALLAVRRRRREHRCRALTVAAPLVARAVADGLDAGFGVRRAITDAAGTAQIEPPAGDELRSVAARLDAGDPLPAALDGWRRRTDEPAHATLVAGLLLYGEAGGELADVLRDQAAALDRARRQTAEADSAVVQARAAARIVGGIPVLAGLSAVAFAPDTVRQVTAAPLGAILVTLAVGLQVVAMIAVRRLAATPR